VHAVEPAATTEDRANHLVHHQPMMGLVLDSTVGSYEDNNVVGKGVFPDDLNFNNTSFDIDQFMPSSYSQFASHGGDFNDAGPCSYQTLVGSLEKKLDGTLGNAMLDKKWDKSTVGLQDMMGNASPLKTTGESSTSFKESSNIAFPTLPLSEIENDNVPLHPSTEEVISFGGIPKPTVGVRSSSRLGGQPNADMPQLEKAMKKAQSRDESFTTCQLAIPIYSIVNIPDSEIVKRATRLGVSLGNSTEEVGKSIKGIKMVEEDRILTILKKQETENENKEEGLETLVLSKVSTLCEDLLVDDDTSLDFEDHLEHIKPLVKVKKTRQRKVYDSTNIRKSTRRRIKKQFS
jgi:hypothetical protein